METNEAPRDLVVCDAGPLIHLDEVDCLDLLSDFSSVLVPDAVWREVEHHRHSALARDLHLRRVSPVREESQELKVLARVFGLHSGEREALRVALEHVPALLLTDDTAARLAAKGLCPSRSGKPILISVGLHRVGPSRKATRSLISHRLSMLAELDERFPVE